MNKNRLAVLALGAVLLTWAIHFGANHAQRFGAIKGHTAPAKDGPSALVRALRPIYPYSVIPGGAYSAGELQFSHVQDAVVRAHYADFDVKRAKLVSLTEDRFQYVSYRIKDQIYWTKRKLRIPKGELLLTDGESYARTRCGNRLSDAPHAAISALEPATAVLSLPAFNSELLPKLAFATPPALGDIPERAMLPAESGSGAISPETPFAGAARIPAGFESAPAGSAGWAPVSPMNSTGGGGGPVAGGLPVAPNSVGKPSKPTPPATTTPPSTQLPPGQPPATPPAGPPFPPPSDTPPVNPVPEPSSFYVFLLSLVFSIWGLLRMSQKDKPEKSQ